MEEPPNHDVVRETLLRSSGSGSRVPVSFAAPRAHHKERAMSDHDAASEDAALSAARLHWRSRRGLREARLAFSPLCGGGLRDLALRGAAGLPALARRGGHGASAMDDRASSASRS